jgi:hypothetical protein
MANHKSRRATRKHGGKRNNRRNVATRKNRGLFESLYRPVSGILRTGTNVVSSGLNTVVDVPTVFVRGAKNTVTGSLKRLVKGADNIGHKATEGVNIALKNAFSRKERKASRKNRKVSRKERKASRKNRKVSRKERKASRKNRKVSRKERKASRKNRKAFVGGKRHRKTSHKASRKADRKARKASRKANRKNYM